ncbi:MAG TPA: hypothetical protein VFF65_06050 [Phycisphaerales bacterium]|nr:hypothetical protein [Phycisphaerales bacterium]
MTTTAVTGNGGEREGRGRLSGRSPAAVVRSAALPATLGDAVLAVTAKTRLWPWERTEVARELCAHFLDGLDAGASPRDLLSSFGDPRLTARLITRARKRSRPWAWHALKRTAQGVGAILLLTLAWYGWSAARFYSGTPTVRFNLQQEINAPAVATPLNERGWPSYRDAFRAMKASGFFDACYAIEGWPTLKPGTPGWEAACAAHNRMEGEIDRMRRATSSPRCAYVLRADISDPSSLGAPLGEEPVPGENPVGMGVLLPQLAVFRAHARVLAFEVRRAAAEGRGADAAADIARLLAMAHHGSEDGTLIGQLVELAIANVAFDSLNEVLRDRPGVLSDAQLQRLAHVVGAYSPGRDGASGAWRPDMRLERRSFEDLLQRFYTDDGEGDGRLCSGVMDYARQFGAREPKAAKFVQPVIGGMVAGRAEMRAAHERLVDRFEAEAAKPAFERNPYAVDEEADALKGSPGVRYSLAVLLAPPLRATTPAFDLSRMNRDATAAGLAIELHTRRHGKPPAAWTEVVPSLLPAAPMDPWTGNPLVLKPGGAPNGRPLIYSVGADRVDDGGKIGDDGDPARVQIARKSGAPVPTWDWVLWPLPESRGPRPMGPAPVRDYQSSTRVYDWGWVGSMGVGGK